MTRTFRVLNGDVVLNPSNGQVSMVSDGVKLKQDLRELLLIETQTDTGFGAGLDSIIGQLPSDELSPGSINFSFGRLLRSSFQRFQSLQRTSQFGKRPLLELADKLIYVQAAPSRTDPTKFRFKVTVSSMAGTQTTLGGTLQI